MHIGNIIIYDQFIIIVGILVDATIASTFSLFESRSGRKMLPAYQLTPKVLYMDEVRAQPSSHTQNWNKCY